MIDTKTLTEGVSVAAQIRPERFDALAASCDLVRLRPRFEEKADEA